MRRPTLPRPRLRRRAPKPAGTAPTTPPSDGPAASRDDPTAPAADTSTPPAGTAVPAAGPATPAPGTDAPAAGTPADAHRRIDGLRAWLAQVDRRLGVRTYALGAAVILALAAGIVGVVLALSVQGDAATNDDLAALRDDLAAVKASAAQAAQRDIQALSDRLDQLESEVTRVTNDQRTTAREI